MGRNEIFLHQDASVQSMKRINRVILMGKKFYNKNNVNRIHASTIHIINSAMGDYSRSTQRIVRCC